MQRLLQVVLVAWAGMLWTICGIVAPSLFKVLPERALAGEVAGHFFSVATWVGLPLGLVAVLASLRAGSMVNRVSRTLLSIAALAPVISELVLGPIMEAARQADNIAKFGMLHGVSALLFGIACVCLLIVVWRTAGNASRRSVGS
jgi:hypothetical protein